MSIEKFRSVEANKVLYAVKGANTDLDALNYVCQYKKANKTDFLHTHYVCNGTIYNNKLYVGDFSKTHRSNCVIVFRNTIDVLKYA